MQNGNTVYNINVILSAALKPLRRASWRKELARSTVYTFFAHFIERASLFTESHIRIPILGTLKLALIKSYNDLKIFEGMGLLMQNVNQYKWHVKWYH